MKPISQNVSRQRKSTRMQGYDYSSAGAYFITLITYQRELLFGDIENGKMKLNSRGEIVRDEWFKSISIRKEIRLYRKPKSLSSFVAGFKSSVTKRIRDELNETGIWHRNYHDRIIRNDHELDAIRKYIEMNPANWEKDEENHP